MQNRRLSSELIPKKSVILQNGPLSAEASLSHEGSEGPAPRNRLTSELHYRNRVSIKTPIIRAMPVIAQSEISNAASFEILSRYQLLH